MENVENEEVECVVCGVNNERTVCNECHDESVGAT